MAKIGEGHGQAWLRAGYDEFTQALQAFPSDIHPVDEPGLFGSATQKMVSNQMGVTDAHLEGAADYSPDMGREMEMGD